MSTQGTAPATGQGGDDARPENDDATLPANQPAEGAAPPTIDPEEAELAAALAAAEAEETGEAASGTEPSAPAQQDTAPPPAGTEPPAQPPATARQPGPIPYDRFAKVAQRARTLEEENAFLSGALTALREGKAPASPQPASPPAPAAPETPDAAIAAAEQRVMEAAEKFDSGDISAVELTRIQTAAAREIADARVRSMMAAAAPPITTESVTDQMVMEQHVKQLETAFPVLGQLNQRQMAFLTTTAEAEAAAAGRAYQPGPRDTMRLREHVARLASVFAPHWGLKAAASPTTAPASNTNTTPASKPGLSPAAQARMQKMDMANGLPPDTARMGQAAGSGEISDAQLLSMSDDEIAALPPTVQARLLNI